MEPVECAFRLPSREDIGDFTSGRLLRDAARLSTRAAAGLFRSFGRIAVEPWPYQLVPLMMALQLDPVRMLIADDVGIGKLRTRNDVLLPTRKPFGTSGAEIMTAYRYESSFEAFL